MEIKSEERASNEPAWIVTYTLTRDDLMAFQRYYAARERLGWRALAAAALMFIVGFALSDSLTRRIGLNSAPEIDVIAGLALSAIGVGGSLSARLFRLRRMKMPAGKVSVEIGPEKIVRTTAGTKAENAWTAIQDVVRKNDAIYLFISKAIAIVIPVRAFATPEDAADCAEFALERWQSRPRGESRPHVIDSPFAVTFSTDDAAIVQQVYSRLGRKHWFKPKNVVEIVLYTVIGFGNTAISLWLTFTASPPNWPTLLIMTIPVSIFARLYHKYAPYYAVKRTRERIGTEPQTIRLNPAGIVFSGSKGTSQFHWESIKRVEEDDRLIYIDLNGGSWFTIPVAAFLDREHHKAFVDAISAYREGRQPDAPAGAIWPPTPET